MNRTCSEVLLTENWHFVVDDMSGWYQRWENNGWRLVSDRVMKRVDQDPVVYESTLKKQSFSHNKVSMHGGK